jgi:hypothetical protein
MDTRSLLTRLSRDNYTDEEIAEITKNLHEDSFPAQLVALDGSEKYSATTIDNSIMFFQDYLKSNGEDTSLLDKACLNGLYHALAKRCEINRDILKNDEITDEVLLSKAKKELLEDTQKLGNLYWSLGYAYACRTLLDIANHLDNKQSKIELGFYKVKGEEKKALKERIAEEKEIFYHFAAVDVIRAAELLQEPTSLYIMTSMFGSIENTDLGWKDPGKAKDDVLGHYTVDDRMMIEKREKANVRKLLNQKL